MSWWWGHYAPTYRHACGVRSSALSPQSTVRLVTLNLVFIQILFLAALVT